MTGLLQLELTPDELSELVARQLANLFAFYPARELPLLQAGIQSALARCEFCFRNTQNKYYHTDGRPCFSPWHSGQYTIFLYYLSNSLFTQSPHARSLADRLYYLNKALNGLDLFYEVQLPRVFFLDHPVGTVLGRANYGEFFRFAQNCSVGNNKGKYPTLADHVTMMSGSKIIGDCHVGHHVIVSANCYIKDTSIPDYSLVFGSSPQLTIKQKDPAWFQNR